MGNATQSAQQRLKRRGADMTIADTQAQIWYETQVKFSHQYGAQDADQRQGDDASRVPEGVDQEAGSQAWTGQLVREGLEAAERQSDLANNGRAFEASDRWVES